MAKTTNILDLNNRLEKVEKENVAQNSYTSLKNKPKINNVTLTGNKSLTDLGAAAAADLGVITDLTTTDKNSVVAAINEVNDKFNELIAVERVYLENSAAINAGDQRSFEFTITKTGYTPIGIVGFGGNGINGLALLSYTVDSSTVASAILKNPSATAITPSSLKLDVLYLKN